MKCETPARSGRSSREPAPIQKPSATERTEATRSEITRSPESSSVRTYFCTDDSLRRRARLSSRGHGEDAPAAPDLDEEPGMLTALEPGDLDPRERRRDPEPGDGAGEDRPEQEIAGREGDDRHRRDAGGAGEHSLGGDAPPRIRASLGRHRHRGAVAAEEERAAVDPGGEGEERRAERKSAEGAARARTGEQRRGEKQEREHEAGAREHQSPAPGRSDPGRPQLALGCSGRLHTRIVVCVPGGETTCPAGPQGARGPLKSRYRVREDTSVPTLRRFRRRPEPRLSRTRKPRGARRALRGP